MEEQHITENTWKSKWRHIQQQMPPYRPWKVIEGYNKQENDVNHMLQPSVARFQPNWTPVGDFGVAALPTTSTTIKTTNEGMCFEIMVLIHIIALQRYRKSAPRTCYLLIVAQHCTKWILLALHTFLPFLYVVWVQTLWWEAITLKQ